MGENFNTIQFDTDSHDESCVLADSANLASPKLHGYPLMEGISSILEKKNNFSVIKGNIPHFSHLVRNNELLPDSNQLQDELKLKKDSVSADAAYERLDHIDLVQMHQGDSPGYKSDDPKGTEITIHSSETDLDEFSEKIALSSQDQQSMTQLSESFSPPKLSNSFLVLHSGTATPYSSNVHSSPFSRERIFGQDKLPKGHDVNEESDFTMSPKDAGFNNSLITPIHSLESRFSNNRYRNRSIYIKKRAER